MSNHVRLLLKVPQTLPITFMIKYEIPYIDVKAF